MRALLPLLLAAPALAQTFTPIPDLPGGTAHSQGRAFSPDGTVVVGQSNGGSGDEAFHWRTAAASVAGLSDLPGGSFSSDAYACSSGGAVVFGFGANAAGGQEAYRWTAATGLQPLGFLPSGGTFSRLYACSNDGSGACGENFSQHPGTPTPFVFEAVRWTPAGGMQGLGFLPGSSHTLSTAQAMSADGAVIVGYDNDTSNNSHPFRWTAATGMVDISGNLFRGLARGLSPDGNTVVGSFVPGSAFVWHISSAPGSITALPLLPGETSPVSAAVDATNGGMRVIGISRTKACLWTRNPDGTYLANDLNAYAPPGWNLTFAASMSDDGNHITGEGVGPSGLVQGWAIDWPTPNCDASIADYNGDGDAATDQDVEAFFACLGGHCCPTCHARGADINGDGDVATDQDIEAFFRCFSGDCCF